MVFWLPTIIGARSVKSLYTSCVQIRKQLVVKCPETFEGDNFRCEVLNLQIQNLRHKWLDERGISRLILDLDGTLMPRNSKYIANSVFEWIQEAIQKTGIKQLLILTNNHNHEFLENIERSLASKLTFPTNFRFDIKYGDKPEITILEKYLSGLQPDENIAIIEDQANIAFRLANNLSKSKPQNNIFALRVLPQRNLIFRYPDSHRRLVERAPGNGLGYIVFNSGIWAFHGFESLTLRKAPKTCHKTYRQELTQ